MEKLKIFISSTMGRIFVTAITAGVVYGVILLAAIMNSFPVALVVFAVCAYFGWKSLNVITPNIFLFMPIVGWIIYCVVKGMISFFIGFIVAPFQIGRIVSKSIERKVVAQ